jgi:hypothetical protein
MFQEWGAEAIRDEPQQSAKSLHAFTRLVNRPRLTLVMPGFDEIRDGICLFTRDPAKAFAHGLLVFEFECHGVNRQMNVAKCFPSREVASASFRRSKFSGRRRSQPECSARSSQSGRSAPESLKALSKHLP